MKSIFFSLSALLFLLLLLSLTIAANTQDTFTLTLLSVSSQENETRIGGTAELFLQLRPGRGAIFIESYPLSKIDTQVATRLANEIACDFSTQDCSSYDFFYTIRADAPLVSGPSAGAATAVLTLAALEDVALLPGAAMTGSISSGGIITPVGGVQEKLEAAVAAKKIIAVVPNLSFSTNDTSNNSLLFSDVSSLPLTIVPVLTLEEAFLAVAKQPLVFLQPEMVVDEFYTEQMRITSGLLCERTDSLLLDIAANQTNTSSYTLAAGFLNQSQLALAQEDYYARASFCYSANINLRKLLVSRLSNDIKLENKQRLSSSIASLDETIDAYDLATFSDLETYFIVKERVLEAQDYLNQINDSAINSRLLALAIERYYSGVAWSEFFGLPGKPLVIDEPSLRLAALQEFEKVESRLNYLQLYLPDFFLVGIQEQLLLAKDYFQKEQYALSLFKATKATANANAYLSTFTLDEAQSLPLVLAKLDRAQVVIAQQRTFPILGYSYYEYANQLVTTDVSTALLYSEYALAFSNLDAYFAPASPFVFLPSFSKTQWYLFLIGFGLGSVLTFLFALFFIARYQKKYLSRTYHKKR